MAAGWQAAGLAIVSAVAGCASTGGSPRFRSEGGVLARVDPPVPVCPAPAAGAPARLAFVHEERIRDSFRLIRARYRVDGRLVGAATPGFEAPAVRLAFDAAVPAGCHVVEAVLDYAPPSFGYDYHVPVRVRASRAITVAPGGAVARLVTGYDRPSITTPPEEAIATRVEAGAGPVPAVVEPSVVAEILAHDGERVAVDATPAKYPSQHVVVGGPGSHDTYLVPVGGEADFTASGDIPPACPGVIHVIGKVISFVGRGKRPGDERPVRETQLAIESWRCR